jgi:hypothetical protein
MLELLNEDVSVLVFNVLSFLRSVSFSILLLVST